MIHAHLYWSRIISKPTFMSIDSIKRSGNLVACNFKKSRLRMLILFKTQFQKCTGVLKDWLKWSNTWSIHETKDIFNFNVIICLYNNTYFTLI